MLWLDTWYWRLEEKKAEEKSFSCHKLMKASMMQWRALAHLRWEKCNDIYIYKYPTHQTRYMCKKLISISLYGAEGKNSFAVFSINFSSINRFFLFEFNYICYSSGLKNWKIFQFASIDQLIETHNSELSRVGMFNEHKKSDRSPHKGVWEWRRRRKKE